MIKTFLLGLIEKDYQLHGQKEHSSYFNDILTHPKIRLLFWLKQMFSVRSLLHQP